jgi:hypothetical protein
VKIFRSIVIGLLLALFTGCTQTQTQVIKSTSTPAIESTATPVIITASPATVFTPTLVNVPIDMMIPYSEDSIWNTPIGPSPRYDPHSQQMISNLVLSNDGEILTPDTYNYPVYFADANTPRWDVPCTTYLCAVWNGDSGSRTDLLTSVPIPVNAQPSPDTDGRMIIIDTTTYAEYDLWRAERGTTGWTTGSGSIYNILWNGTPELNNSRGSGIPSYAGLLRPWEILQGRIQHALAFGYTEPAQDKCVFPASKTDGDSKLLFAIPEGARIQLDPSLTDKDFDQMGLDRAGKIIAKALQQYGMILVDHSGSYKIYLEDLANNPYTTQKWTDPAIRLTNETIANIPYTYFRVLELPPGYWEPSANTQYHGKCFAFPGTP